MLQCPSRTGACGYYALHNGLVCLELATCNTDAEAREWVANLTDPIDFWHRFQQLYRFLRTHTNDSTCVLTSISLI